MEREKDHEKTIQLEDEKTVEKKKTNAAHDS